MSFRERSFSRMLGLRRLVPAESSFSGGVLECTSPRMSVNVRHRSVKHGSLSIDPENGGARLLGLDSAYLKHMSTSFINGWRPLLYILKFFGFYPYKIGTTSNRLCLKLPQIYGWYVVVLFFMLLNGALLIHNLADTIEYWRANGGLHLITVSSIVTGLLPMQNLLNLLLFTLGQKVHRQLLQQMEHVHLQFQTKLDTSIRLKPRVIGVYVATSITICVSVTIRIIDVALQERERANSFFVIVTLLIVPALRVWQLLPLFYFEALNSSVRYWFRELNECLERDQYLAKNSLTFYYKQFLQLTVVVSRMGKWLNAFIFFSLAFSLVNFCLAIYFLTQNFEFVDMFIFGEGRNEQDVRSAQFYISYASLQVGIAVVYVFTICVTGRRTNEEARKIMATALTINCRNEEDRFAVIRFVQKMNCQYYWGITVWRTFPIERSLLFTLTGGVMAYAVILTKMKKEDALPAHVVKGVLQDLFYNCTCG